MTFFALNNHSKRTLGSENGIFFRLALRARHDYVLPNQTFEENLTVQEKGCFFSVCATRSP